MHGPARKCNRSCTAPSIGWNVRFDLAMSLHSDLHTSDEKPSATLPSHRCVFTNRSEIRNVPGGTTAMPVRSGEFERSASGQFAPNIILLAADPMSKTNLRVGNNDDNGRLVHRYTAGNLFVKKSHFFFFFKKVTKPRTTSGESHRFGHSFFLFSRSRSVIISLRDRYALKTQ